MRNLRIIFLLLTILGMAPVFHAQQAGDMELVRKTVFTDPSFNKREVRFLMSDKKNVIVKYNPVTLTLGSLMYLYQTTVSQQLHSDCPYQLSCSNFSHKAISRHGIFKGICLTADRLMRCNPPSVREVSPNRLDQNNRIIDDPSQYQFRP